MCFSGEEKGGPGYNGPRKKGEEHGEERKKTTNHIMPTHCTQVQPLWALGSAGYHMLAGNNQSGEGGKC